MVTGTGIILQSETNRIPDLVEGLPVCQEVVGKLEMPGGEMMGGKMGERENVVVRCQDASGNTVSVLTREDIGKDEFVKKATSVTAAYSTAASGCYGGQGEGGILVSEKKIEITGYYHKDVANSTVIEEAQDRHAEKDGLDTPPPLPLTGKHSFLPSAFHRPGVSFLPRTLFLIRPCFRYRPAQDRPYRLPLLVRGEERPDPRVDAQKIHVER